MGNIEELVGETILKIDINNRYDEIIFWISNGFKYVMKHDQDCCESVCIDDINGNMDDLIGTPLLQSTESYNSDDNIRGDESFTWTFYKFATIKGYVTIKWYGTSNGYYSESVDLHKYEDKENIQKIKIEIRDRSIDKLL